MDVQHLWYEHMFLMSFICFFFLMGFPARRWWSIYDPNLWYMMDGHAKTIPNCKHTHTHTFRVTSELQNTRIGRWWAPGSPQKTTQCEQTNKQTNNQTNPQRRNIEKKSPEATLSSGWKGFEPESGHPVLMAKCPWSILCTCAQPCVFVCVCD